MKKITIFALLVVVCAMTLTGCNAKIDSVVSDTQQAFDRLMAGEKVPASELRLAIVGGPQPFIENWCNRHHVRSIDEAGKMKINELFKAFNNMRVQLDQPVTAEASVPAK